ncbi:Down syndrome cell adhesion molecule 1 homolog, partial [Paramuricea clavata]
MLFSYTVQTPAPVYDIKIIQSDYSAQVIWKLQTFDSVSSIITQIVIHLNGTKHKNISPRTQYNITGLNPYTAYTVGIQTVQGDLQKSRIVSENFKTNEAVPSGPPLNVTFTSRGKYSLNVSWNAPNDNLWNGKPTGYLVCYSSRARTNNPRCYGRTAALSLTINNLQPSTEYFVTVSAATSVGGGLKSAEISKITNG